MTTTGAYKIEQYYQDNCHNEKDFNDKLKSMTLKEIKEIVL